MSDIKNALFSLFSKNKQQSNQTTYQKDGQSTKSTPAKDDLKPLFDSLSSRQRPEDVAKLILPILQDNLTPNELSILQKATKPRSRNFFWDCSSMPTEFYQVVGAKHSLIKINELFDFSQSQLNPIAIKDTDTKALDDIARFANQQILKKKDGNNFSKDRLNKESRHAQGISLSKRQYNKRWRLLKRFEKKQQKIAWQNDIASFQRIAKHGFAEHINEADFFSCVDSACFIAYYVARCNLRSEFTNTSQVSAYDEICQMLMERCRANPDTAWYAIAHCYTSESVLGHLTDYQKGELLGKWTNLLQTIAGYLEILWHSNDIRPNMVVQRGNDSSTWNHTAGAWNKARDQWINLIYSLNMQSILEVVCFGKVLRLMAGDVAAWHINSGGSLHPDTIVWQNLPKPWQVFMGTATCARDDIIAACYNAKIIDYQKSGWIAPRHHGIAKFTPTPELVHGVAVASPFLANLLRKQGYFSGKPLKNP